MVKSNFGDCVGKCAICTINLWSSTGGKPVVWPCNIKDCPYEDPNKQHRHLGILDGSTTGSGLAQIDF